MNARNVASKISNFAACEKSKIFRGSERSTETAKSKISLVSTAIVLCVVLSVMPFASAADTTNQNTTGTDSTTDQTLKLGMTSDKVSELQKWLKEGHFYTGEIDGNFSEHTAEAVKLFQKTVGLKEDGEVGNITQNYIKLWDQGKITATSSDNDSTSTTTTSSNSYKTSKSTGTNSKKTYSTSSSYSSSKYGYTNGMDCWAMSDYISGQLNSQGYTTRIIQYPTSMSSNHRTVQYYSNGNWVNYDYAGNGYNQIYYTTSNYVNGAVVS